MTRWILLTALLLATTVLPSCYRHPDLGPLVDRELEAPQEVQGLTISGPATFYENGGLHSALLHREDTLFGHVFPAGSRITLRPDSTLNWTFLAHDAPLEGILCRGHGHDYMNAFHPNGRLRLAWLADDQVVQGVPCMGSSFWRDTFGGGVGVYFATNGRLIKAKLSEDVNIQGVAFEKGDHVRFDSLGVLLTDVDP
jgi:hypothetical protein